MINTINTVLVANRGEIACRVIRTLRDQGVRSVAVYSDADADAPHVRAADVAVHTARRRPASPTLVADHPTPPAARRAGDPPGYGFLSENAAFARACEDAGIIFMGLPHRPSTRWATRFPPATPSRPATCPPSPAFPARA